MQVYRKVSSFFKKIGSSLLELAFSIVPDTNGTRSLGSTTKRWGDVYATNIYGSATNLTDLPSSEVVDDLTPQLGGDLDTNGNKVTSTAWTELDGTSGIRLRSGGSMKMNIGAVGVQPMANIIPNVDNSYDLGISGYGFKQVHADSFHGNVHLNKMIGTNGTDIYMEMLGSYLSVKKNILPSGAPYLGQSGQYFKQVAGETLSAQKILQVGHSSYGYGTLQMWDGVGSFLSLESGADRIAPNTDGLLDWGIATKKFKEIHAVSFHGDGSNLTNLPENDLLKYVVVKGKMIFPATPSNVVYDQHYKQGLDDHATADLGNIQNYQRDLVDYSTFASGKTASEMVTIKGLYEVVGWEYQIATKTADNSNPDLNFYPMIYDNTGAMTTFGGITLNNKYVDNAYTTSSGTIINMGHMWVAPYAKRRTGSVAIQETLINYEIRFKLAKVV